MKSNERRALIRKLLVEATDPIKGITLAQSYNVTRQVIVKDIAIMRASGDNIMATPDGYVMGSLTLDKCKAIIAVSHNEDQLEEELKTIIKYGGIVEDVIVEHSLYGEIKAMLMIKNLNDVDKFVVKYKRSNSKMLSILTNGVHLHTIIADNNENLNLIINELTQKGYIIN